MRSTVRGCLRATPAIVAVATCTLSLAAEIDVPNGFRASVFHEGVGPARHLAVRDNGDVYVALRYHPAREGTVQRDGGLVALRDADGDGCAEELRRFGPGDVGTGIGIHDGQLYFSTDQAVYRVKLEAGALVPSGTPELIAGGFPVQQSHAAKSITFDGEGHLYVNSGAPSNACQQQDRTPGSPGLKPCPLLERSGGIWRFDAATIWQDQGRDGTRYLTGIRNVVALAWHPQVDKLYFVMHGRDQLDTLWPDRYTAEERAELPAEEFHVAAQGEDFGWPYTYYDGLRAARMLAPEYGGDGKQRAEGDYPPPLIAFPAHWAPNALLIYQATQFPPQYRGGAFIAFHGSWNRAPSPQGGYNVVFAPLDKAGRPSGPWQVFAADFAGGDPLINPADAAHRPTGLAVGPDGALYVSESVVGRIWRITYEGEQATADEAG